MTLDVNNLNPPADPRLDSLLDEALSPASIPGGVPAGLADRIVARTAPLLPVRSRATREDVVARIGPAHLAAMAATLLLTLGAGVWMSAQRGRVGASLNETSGTWSGASIAVIERGLDQLAAATTTDEEIDHEIALLALRVDSAGEDYDWDPAAIDRAVVESEIELRSFDSSIF